MMSARSPFGKRADELAQVLVDVEETGPLLRRAAADHEVGP